MGDGVLVWEQAGIWLKEVGWELERGQRKIGWEAKRK